jgi:hypothetical protein
MRRGVTTERLENISFVVFAAVFQWKKSLLGHRNKGVGTAVRLLLFMLKQLCLLSRGIITLKLADMHNKSDIPIDSDASFASL